MLKKKKKKKSNQMLYLWPGETQGDGNLGTECDLDGI